MFKIISKLLYFYGIFALSFFLTPYRQRQNKYVGERKTFALYMLISLAGKCRRVINAPTGFILNYFCSVLYPFGAILSGFTSAVTRPSVGFLNFLFYERKFTRLWRVSRFSPPFQSNAHAYKTLKNFQSLNFVVMYAQIF